MIRVALPYPISANRYWAERVVPAAKGRPAFVQHYVTPEARKYRNTVAELMRAAGVLEPIHGRVRVRLELYPHRPLDWQTRQRKLGDAWDDEVQCIDLDNARKVLLDALNGVAFDDDSRIWSDGGDRMEPDAHGARVIVHVEALQPRGPQQVDLLEVVPWATLSVPRVPAPAITPVPASEVEVDAFGPIPSPPPRRKREHAQ